MSGDNTPTTPPSRHLDLSRLQATPEHEKQIEINRLKAKAAQREKEQQSSSSYSSNANNKRPLNVIPAGQGSPTRPVASSSKPLKRDSRLGTYFEYDLSKMVNTKGGFLVNDGGEADEELRRKEREKEREKQRTQHNLEIPMFLDPSLNPHCRECDSMDVDPTFLNAFKCHVCKKCQNEKSDTYGLLTKTECREDYLLTDPELRDEEAMPHLLKANPHKATYANMMLFLRYQVEEFAWKKWGSPEALDAEYRRREAEKTKKKNKKFEQSLKDLRKRTKEGVWQRRRDEEHKHVFGKTENIKHGIGKQLPVTGNFTGPSKDQLSCRRSPSPPMSSNSHTPNQAEHEHISTSLEVEQLEVNLFRSKSLYMPARARGVFGGQVISQALVSATTCVSTSYALHSLHCYFLATASAATPIVYQVDRVRDGSSYVTRGVRALQNGRTIFLMVCSFHKPEPWQPLHQWKMPDVPPPEQCEDDEEMLRRFIRENSNSPEVAERFKELLIQRERSPVTSNTAKFNHIDENGVARFLYWMKARDVPKYEASFQKCILSYMSDLRFIYTAVVIAGLKNSVSGESGPQYLGMNSSIDHVVWFYDHNFDCGDWLLYEMECPRIGSGRAVVHGRIFTRHGKLVAVTSQEGVLRAKIRGPTGSTLTPSKL